MTATATTLRLAHAADSGALVELFRQLGYAVCADELATRLAGDGGGRAHTMVAEAAGRVQGVVVVHVIEPIHVAGRWGLVSALVVDEAVRGAGVGALLLGAAERFAWEQGCSQVELSSSERRTRAHAFYVQQGFAEVRKRFVKRRPAETGAPP